MLAEPGRPVTKVSSQLDGCTLHNNPYPIKYRDGCTYNFWDTPGLNGSEYDAMSPQHTIQNLQNLVKDQQVDLFIYCIRDRLVDIIRFNYELVWKNPRRGKAPILLVVTGLEGRYDMEGWWGENEKTIETMKMTFDGHACVTSCKGRNNMYGEEYKESAEKVWSLVTEHCGPRHNIILFGEGGCGKSSIVNMIVGKDVAKVSSGLEGCTFENDAYNAIIEDKHYVLYDTAGLNEGQQGRVPHWKAIRALYMLVRQLDGVSLLIYCMRGRIKKNAKANWDLFNKVICGGRVPTIAIVTGLDSCGDLEVFMREKDNSGAFKKNGMEPKGVGCVVSIRENHADIYAKSQVKVRALITEHCLQKSWSEEKEKWFAAIYSEVYKSALCFVTQSRLDYSTRMKDIVNEFVRETEMNHEDAKKLRATLVNAEKKFRRTKLWYNLNY